jgi:ParB family chromosome partitioning protein
MSKATGNLNLAGYNDIFGSGTVEVGGERIVELPLAELFPPDCHPFYVKDDDEMTRLMESVKQYGVREPGLVRPRSEGGYELLAGNRRKRACELAEIATLPVIIRELDDDSAVIALVDSNLEHRERILPSEKAWAYRMKMEALNHSGVKDGEHSADVITKQTGDCKNTIFRLIRLTELLETLMDKVDTKQLAFNPAVELSYLSFGEQGLVLDAMTQFDTKPTLSQAVSLRKLKQVGSFTAETIAGVLAPKQKPPKEDKVIAKFKQFFPESYTPKQIERVIVDLLKDWQSTQIIDLSSDEAA